MTAVTLCIAIAAALAAWWARPIVALAIYCATLVFYPYALTVQIGTADFSVSRICILAVLAGAARFGRHRSFQWVWTDVFILAAWAFGLVALLQTFPGIALERQAGVFFDTILPYLAARLIVTSQEELGTLIKTIAVFAALLVPLALVQMFTGTNPVGFLSEYYSFGMKGERAEHPDVRLGLHRAAVTFPHAIHLGMFFVMSGVLTLTLWKSRLWPRAVVAALTVAAAIGLFTTLSSGPLVAAAAAALAFAAYADWRLMAALAGFAVVAVAFLSAYSGEPWLEVMTDFALNPVNAEFRLNLYREALGGGMSGHWWTGYGYVGLGPGTDNTGFHWRHDDILGLYLQILVRTGLLGLLPFLLATVFYCARLGSALASAATPQASWSAWCLLAVLVGWNAGLMTVGPGAVILQFLYLLIAVSANMPDIVADEGTRAA
jgi:hypothetical protein